MKYLALTFWVLNLIVSVYGIYHWSQRWNPRGVWGLATPAGWVWIWQLAGVGLVAFLGWSAWHLVWWFPAGWIVCVVIGRLLYLTGVLDL